LLRLVLLASLLLSIGGGCGTFAPIITHANRAPRAPIDNPAFVTTRDYDLLWEQIVDAVDNNFTIRSEQRVRLVAGQLSEGRLETYPRIGSTLLEPWHTDSTAGYEKLESTLQTIRRRVIVLVTPEQGGFWISVEVHKEMEVAAGQADERLALDGVRFDGTLRSGDDDIDPAVSTRGWMPLCRDVLLEQRILQDITARLEDIETDKPAGPLSIHH